MVLDGRGVVVTIWVVVENDTVVTMSDKTVVEVSGSGVEVEVETLMESWKLVSIEVAGCGCGRSCGREGRGRVVGPGCHNVRRVVHGASESRKCDIVVDRVGC